jgi:hypothetical protein
MLRLEVSGAVRHPLPHTHTHTHTHTHMSGGKGLIYFVNQTLHVPGVFIAHHQEVFTVYVQRLVRVISLS